MKWRSLEESTPQAEVRSLSKIYAERKALIAKYVPEEIQAIHVRAVAEMKQSGIVDRVLNFGSKSPAFELPDHNGKLVSSSEILRSGRMVICFFRGRWCPFCVGQMEAMTAIVPQLQECGATVVAISPQTVHQSSLMADQHKLRFPLLSDMGNEVARQFRVAYRVPEYQQEIYRRVFVNLPFVNGDPGWELPIPSTFIVDRPDTQTEPHDSIVLYSAADPDYTNRPEPADLLQFLAQLPA